MPWGRVIDSLTGEPLSLAVVTLFDRSHYGRVVGRVVTDKTGRYSFAAEAGDYSLWTTRPGYIFPSSLVPKSYHGITFEVGKEGMIVLDLLCDPLVITSGWRLKWQQWLLILDTVRIPFLIAGSLISIYFLLSKASVLSLAIFAFYLVIWMYHGFRLSYRRHTLSIVDDSGKPISYAIVRLVSKKDKTITTTRVADVHGEIYILVPKGDYTLQVTDPANARHLTETISLPDGVFTRHRIVHI